MYIEGSADVRARMSDMICRSDERDPGWSNDRAQGQVVQRSRIRETSGSVACDGAGQCNVPVTGNRQ
jgi:hypothetical protein